MSKSKCHCFKKTIKIFDIFASTISFTINNGYRYHSFIGGLLFIFFFMIAIVYSIYCTYGFLTRKNIDFIYARKVLETGSTINLKEVSFNLGFGLQTFGTGGDYIFPNEDYFNYNMEFIDWIGDDVFIKKKVDLKPCEKEDFNNMVNYFFETNGVQNLLCPIVDDSLNYTISGLYTDYYFRYISLNYYLSDYALNHLEETKNFLNENPLEMSLYFIDTSYDFKSRKNFVSTKLNFFFRPIDLNFEKYTTIYISHLDFSNDENLIIRKVTKKSNSIYDLSIDSFKYIENRNSEKNLIGQFKIQASSKVYQLQRNYQKLPAFIAELAGFIGMLLLILLFLIRFLERQIIDNKLINHMLNFKGSKFNDVEYFINSFNLDKKYNKISSILSNERIIKNNLSMHKKVTNELNLESENDIKLNSSVNNNNYYHKKTISSIIKNNKNSGRKIIIKDDIKDNLNQENNPQTEETLKNNNEEETHDKINNDKLNSSENLNKNLKKKLNQKEKNIKLFPLSYSEYFIASICFCCTQIQKKRKNATKSAEFRIHYFMDIFNFIKKMQEIDLLKYCLFDKDQIMLFDFTSKTPFKIGNDGQEIIFRDREKIMINKKNFEKDDLDDIFNSYRIIRIKDELSYEDIKLMELVKSEVEFLGEA